MSPEEYQRLKEAEKAHLRSLRELKQAVRGLNRQKKLTDAVVNATVKPMASLDDHDALVQELAMETARNEARLDVALESIGADPDKAGPTSAQVSAADEDLLRKAKAADLVRQLKLQLGVQGPDVSGTRSPAASNTTAAESKSASDASASVPSPPLPDKTIGRMKP
ncbi:MAG: DNA-binding PucR family transcriptional regulator [Rhodothermales bacterium]